MVAANIELNLIILLICDGQRVKVATGRHDGAAPALSTTNLPPQGLSAAATTAGIISSSAPSRA